MVNMNNDDKYMVWFAGLHKIDIKRKLAIIDCIPNIKELWNMKKDELKSIELLKDKHVEVILDCKYRNKIDEIMYVIEKSKIGIISILDKNYPRNLKEIYDPPIVLFYKGNTNFDNFMVALVGSRKLTSYGSEVAYKLSYELALNGICVVSGGAYGIDTRAHRGAMDVVEQTGNINRTIAVLGCGLDIVYPKENKSLISEIEQKGMVISEYLPGTKPLGINFPRRNRIISGLCQGVIVVEAASKSGAVITANTALEQGRGVFAVPGNIDSINSFGTNCLIKDGAKIVTCIDDILEEFSNFTLYKRKNDKNNEYYENNETNLSDIELRVINELRFGSNNIDFLMNKLNTSIKILNPVLMMMEMKGLVEQLPGKVFKLTNHYKIR
jgi:DNA processing protein